MASLLSQVAFMASPTASFLPSVRLGSLPHPAAFADCPPFWCHGCCFPPTFCTSSCRACSQDNSPSAGFPVRAHRKSGAKRFQEILATKKYLRRSQPTMDNPSNVQEHCNDVCDQVVVGKAVAKDYKEGDNITMDVSDENLLGQTYREQDDKENLESPGCRHEKSVLKEASIEILVENDASLVTIKPLSLVDTEQESFASLLPDLETADAIMKDMMENNDFQGSVVETAGTQNSFTEEAASNTDILDLKDQDIDDTGNATGLNRNSSATPEQRDFKFLAEHKRLYSPEGTASNNSSNSIWDSQITLVTSNKQRKDDKCIEDRPNPLQDGIRELLIKDLAERCLKFGNKIFFYPEVVHAGTEVEVFLNQRITALADKPKVFTMGAFNDWRWKSFVIELGRKDLPGDWLAFKLEVPNEAYKIDFVFFDGDKLYENNSNRDFFVLVEGGMEKEDFDDYLTEEKRKEAERLSAEQLQKEQKYAEEQRQAQKIAAEKADRAEAKRQVSEQREKARRVLQKAVRTVEGLWKFEPFDFQGGDIVKLFYNRACRSLASSDEIWIHGGYNNWQETVSIVGKLSTSNTEGGDWWSIDVAVPEHAYVLNWVFADGPPGKAIVYDNNYYQDFHALVPNGVPDDFYWDEVEQQIFKKISKERHEREEAAQRKAKHTTWLKEQLKLKTKELFVRSQAHIFYTDPIDVHAGSPVTVFYNPSNTILNGKSETWIRGSFNRWKHKHGNFPPIKMEPTGMNAYLKAVVEVPRDAYVMDFVFSEWGGDDGGTYDNRNGLDYHVPVVGGNAKEPPMHVVHISVEMAPIAKVGGLGDVVTGLSRAIQDIGHNVEVVLPKYDCLNYKHVQDLAERESFFLGGTRIKVWNAKVEGLSVIFLEPENGMFWVGCIYGRRDDGQRFEFFCNVALEFLLRSGRHPDIIHCHDWSTAPVAWLFQDSYRHYGLTNARIVFTIHNLEYGTPLIGKAMSYADRATTVSYSYAQEISGNNIISPHRHKLHGIRNGIDLDIWDPYNDPFIPLSYTSAEVVEGKRAAKAELQCRLSLTQSDRPLVGIVTRLTAQKGIHLIKHGLWRTLDRSGQVVLLGTAPDPRIQNDFNNLANQLQSTNSGMARLCLSYDEPLSHLIYAGADFILIPSMFEPCGLTQLIAMRYGAIPVVRRTGGLNDTVFDVYYDKDRAQAQGIVPNGFCFDGTDAAAVDYAVNRALSAWYDARDWFNCLCSQVMNQDWSWSGPALAYMELYYSAKK
eukprot:c28356_g1_i1 orf=2-3733(+)